MGIVGYKMTNRNTTLPPVEKRDLPLVGRFVVDPKSIESGSPATLHWDVTGATEVVLDPGIGRVAATGVIEVNPARSLTYVLTAKGPGGSVSKEVQLSVAPARPGENQKANQVCEDAEAKWQAHQSRAARELFSQAAKMGSSQCMVELAEIEMDDDDPGDAVQWFRKASERGNVSGMLHLGVMYQLGIGGVLEDPARSAYWYGQAAQRGNADAMYNLGVCTKPVSESRRIRVRLSRSIKKPPASVTQRRKPGSLD